MPDTITSDQAYHLRAGNALVAEARFKEARQEYYQALQLGPAAPDVLLTLGGCCGEQGALEEAIVHTRASLALAPRDPRAHVQLGILCLILGLAEPGWRELSHRRNLVPSPMPPAPPIPDWNGGPLEGRGILLLHEQGLGDVLHCARYVHQIQERGGVVYMDIQEPLKRLLIPHFRPGTVMERGQSAQISTYAYMLELPRLLGDHPHGPPGARPYLAVPAGTPRPSLPARPAGTRRIGLAWAGSPNHARDRLRSIPLELWKPVLDVQRCQFVSLMEKTRAPEIARAGVEDRVVDLSSQMTDLLDVAALIQEMDLVLTVDTAVAHLAGAMGKPTWMLVTNPPDWRWGRAGASTAWYPSMRLFRQEEAANWLPVIDRVVRELAG